MIFLVTSVYGSARGNECETTVLGVTEAATPEKALQRFRQEYMKQWVPHSPTRTDSYVRIEDPVSFVSDKISYLAAQAGELVRNSEGKIRFLLALQGGALNRRLSGGTTQERVDTVWAASAREALLSRSGPKPDGELVERGAGRLFATYREKHERGSKIAPRCWQAAADVILTTRAGE